MHAGVGSPGARTAAAGDENLGSAFLQHVASGKQRTVLPADLHLTLEAHVLLAASCPQCACCKESPASLLVKKGGWRGMRIFTCTLLLLLMSTMRPMKDE
jgi:hypothetical protein